MTSLRKSIILEINHAITLVHSLGQIEQLLAVLSTINILLSINAEDYFLSKHHLSNTKPLVKDLRPLATQPPGGSFGEKSVVHRKGMVPST